MWPRGLVRKVIDGLLLQQIWSGVAEGNVPLEDGEDREEEQEADMQEDETEDHSGTDREQPLTEEQKDMISRLHINMGHLPKNQMRQR